MTNLIQILYKDEHLVAVNKPAGYLVHPSDNPEEGDLVIMKILRDQLGKKVYPIHRLDRPTSGVLVFGLEKESATLLTDSLMEKKWKKVYWALIRGIPQGVKWECQEPVRKTPDAPEQQAHTSFTLLRSMRHPALSDLRGDTTHGDYLHLIKATPHTGRYHQIRKHLLHYNTPIIGDYRYAGIEESDKVCNALGIGTRMLLTARHLTLPHPIKKSALTISAPLDSAIDQCLSAS